MARMPPHIRTAGIAAGQTRNMVFLLPSVEAGRPPENRFRLFTRFRAQGKQKEQRANGS
jgi:hypothetical protein